MQPFRYNGITVYMNGEIFNYTELLEEHKSEFISKGGSDVEILPFLYTKYGIDFLNRLNGMFALVVIDDIRNIKFLIRDRFAEKPLYYIQDNESLIFASEVKAIKKIKKLEVDKTNLQMNFICWFLPQPFSLYKDTFNVNPGSYIQYKNGKIKEVRWYNPKIIKNEDTEEEVARKFIELYKSSIELRLRSDVPVGVFLSGGLDSTSIGKFSADIMKSKFSAFCANIEGKESQEFNNTDSVIPERLANDLGIPFQKSDLNYQFYNNNIVSLVRNYDEIFMDSGILVFYRLANLAKKNDTSVILTGVAGDELFGGYPWQSGNARRINSIFKFTYNKFKPIDIFFRMALTLNRKLASAYRLLFDYKVWHAESLSSFSYDFRKSKTELENKIRHNAEKYFDIAHDHVGGDIYNTMAYANTFTLVGTTNHFVDSASMMNSVENRAPFLDHRLYEFLMSVPDNLKFKYGPKGLLRKILKKHFPDYETEAKKSGPTMPISIWLYKQELNRDIFLFIEKHKKYIDEYLDLNIQLDKGWVSDKKNALKLFAIISFVIWFKANVLNDIQEDEITFEALIRC